MKAVLCRGFSGPDAFEVGEAPDPIPAADEILIEAHAASVTFMDRPRNGSIRRRRGGETAVVIGAGGGVGMAAVDIARHLGGRVIALVDSETHVAALRRRGVAGEVPKPAMNPPLPKNFSVVGVFAGAWEDREPEAARQAKETVMEWIGAAHLRPHVGLVVPIEEIGRAMAAIGDRSATGRVVVKVR